MTELILVKAADCQPLRQAVLHAGESAAAAVYPGDDDERSLHLAVKQGRRVLGVLSLLHEERDGLGSEVWRARGVAVAEASRRRGIGRQLLLAAQAVVEKRGGGMWCRSRGEARPFLQAFGFHPQDGADTDGAPGVDVPMVWRPAP